MVTASHNRLISLDLYFHFMLIGNVDFRRSCVEHGDNFCVFMIVDQIESISESNFMFNHTTPLM